jgi:hypothetical protein
VLNARYLQHEGYDAIIGGDELIFAALDDFLDRAAAGLI